MITSISMMERPALAKWFTASVFFFLSIFTLLSRESNREWRYILVNLLLVRSHQAEIIIVKRLIQGCNSDATRVEVESISYVVVKTAL